MNPCTTLFKKKLIPIYFFLISIGLASFTLDKNELYKALSGDSVESINRLLLKLEREKKSAKKNAYRGALTAKKANFEKGASEKIKTFKSGVGQLEQEISNDPVNVEFRFLRLCIQEHAPKILRYNKNLNDDALIIQANFSKQSISLQSIIKNYALGSTELEVKSLK